MCNLSNAWEIAQFSWRLNRITWVRLFLGRRDTDSIEAPFRKVPRDLKRQNPTRQNPCPCKCICMEFYLSRAVYGPCSIRLRQGLREFHCSAKCRRRRFRFPRVRFADAFVHFISASSFLRFRTVSSRTHQLRCYSICARLLLVLATDGDQWQRPFGMRTNDLLVAGDWRPTTDGSLCYKISAVDCDNGRSKKMTFDD